MASEQLQRAERAGDDLAVALWDLPSEVTMNPTLTAALTAFARAEVQRAMEELRTFMEKRSMLRAVEADDEDRGSPLKLKLIAQWQELMHTTDAIRALAAKHKEDKPHE